MDPAELKRLKKIPSWLIPGCGKSGAPGMIKRHVAPLCLPINHEWRLFSEGCLRNRFFRSEVLKSTQNCPACSRKHNQRSRIEQHHNDYLWSCIGPLLPPDSDDVHRKPTADEYPDIPDCRACKVNNPAHFAQCLKRIHPVHANCHERIHAKERYFRKRDSQNLLDQFAYAAFLEGA